MSSTVAIIQVRLPTQLHKQTAARKLGSRSLLEHVVRSVTDCQRLDGVLVVAGDGPDDASIADMVPTDVSIHTSSRRDMLGRFASAVDAADCEAVVRVLADNPFVDPVLIDGMVTTAEAHPRCDYITHRSNRGRSTILSSFGLFGEWCRADAVRKADREATSPTDREQVTRYLYSHPERFQLRFIPAPSELERDDLCLAIENEEAWEQAQTLYEALGPEGLNWRRIAGLWRGPAAGSAGKAASDRRHAPV